MNPQVFFNSRYGVGLALALSRSVPARAGHSVARFLADRISHKKEWDLVRSIRLNQWVASGCTLSAPELDEIVQLTLRHTARCLYDLYHNLHDLPSTERMIDFSPEVNEIITSSREGRHPMMVVGVHMSNFDMVAQACAMRGMKAQAISAARPTSGYEWQNDIREASGLEITPASKSALRRAEKRLEEGGVVLTGLDRPVASTRYHPVFFGYPSNVPVHYIQIALKSRAPVIVAAAIMRPDGVYTIHASEPIYLRSYSNHHAEVLNNVQAILEVAEDYIRRAPYQWGMSFPVWPDLFPSLP